MVIAEAPDFFVIGAGRAGTTSLHRYLRQHPDVFLPVAKAPSFYYCSTDGASRPVRRRTEIAHFVCDPADYARLFDRARPGQVCGDVSPVYLASTAVPERIARANPDARLVAVLRDPAERVRARFDGRRRDGLERRTTLAEVVEAEIGDPPWPSDTAGTYVASGFVSHVLARYFDHFERDRILVLTTEDLAADPAGVTADVLGFVGVDPTIPVDTTEAHNRSGGPIRNPVVRRLWTSSVGVRTRLRPLLPEAWRDAAYRRVVRTGPAERDPEVMARLRAHYAEEVERCSVLVGRDLTPWTRGESVPGRRIR